MYKTFAAAAIAASAYGAWTTASIADMTCEQLGAGLVDSDNKCILMDCTGDVKSAADYDLAKFTACTTTGAPAICQAAFELGKTKCATPAEQCKQGANIEKWVKDNKAAAESRCTDVACVGIKGWMTASETWVNAKLAECKQAGLDTGSVASGSMTMGSVLAASVVVGAALF